MQKNLDTRLEQGTAIVQPVPLLGMVNRGLVVLCIRIIRR